MRPSYRAERYLPDMDSKKIKAAAISSEPQEQFHSPVMAKEVVEYLNLPDGAIVVDATVGLGGHSECLLNTYPLIIKAHRNGC